MTHCENAKAVLATEIKGLGILKENLGEEFNNAVDRILQSTGRVVISGMGKSGHIGAKIAATMSSTGTPAYFVHPGEASHGDMGMITKDDVVILLSNSGETKELADIIEYVTRNSIPSIAITKKPNSTLAQSVDVLLLLPDIEEACPLGLAPTTSTTATLVYGDALSVALLKAKNFTASDFKQFHPGGKLGQQLLRVSDIMQNGDVLPLVNHGTLLHNALDVMAEKRFGCVGVEKDNTLIGIFTDGDLLRHFSTTTTETTIDDVMTKNPIVVNSDTLASEVLSILENRKVSALFVQDNNTIQGIIHFHDILKSGVA